MTPPTPWRLTMALALSLSGCGSSHINDSTTLRDGGSGADGASADAKPTTSQDSGSVTATPDASTGSTDPVDINPDLTHACDPGAATFFVAPGGNNSASGHSGTPWKTLQHALDTLMPGQTACVAAGTYTEDLSFTRSGTSGKYITLMGTAATRDAQILGGGILRNASYVRLANFKMKTQSRNNEPLAILGGKNLQLVNLEIYDSNKLWWSSVDQLLLRSSWIHHNNIGIDCTPGPCTNVTIVDTLLECSGFSTTGAACVPATSFTFGGATDGFGGEANTMNFTIIRSTSRNNQTDGWDIKGSNMTFIDSYAYGNGGGGFKIWGGGNTRLENCVAFHNHNGFEFYESSGAMYQIVNSTSADNNLTSLSVYSDNGHFPTKIDARNSIFAFSHDGNTYDDDVMVTGSSNLYFATEDAQVKGGTHNDLSKADVRAGKAPDGMALSADPLFITRDTGMSSNYGLRAGSPAINSGTTDRASTHDIVGMPRPQGAGIDRGAYEMP